MDTTTRTNTAGPPPSLGWSVTLGCDCCACCFGKNVPISFHWTFFFVWVLQIVIAVITQAKSWKYIVYVATLWGPVLAMTVLLHEYGHVVRNRSFGGTCSYINLWPLGGFSDTRIYNGTCLQEFWTAFCGPLMHLPQMCLWVVVIAVCAPNGLDYYGQGLNITSIDDGGAGIWFAQLAKGALDLNIMIFAMNMVVPSYPLDAARMVASMAVHCGLSVLRAAYLLLIVGGLLGLGAVIWGVVSLINQSGLGITMLIIGLFLLWTTYTMYTSIKSEQIFRHPIFQPDCYRSHRRHNANEHITNVASSPTAERMSRQPVKQSQPNKTKTKTSEKSKNRGSPQTNNANRKKNKKNVERNGQADTSDDSFNPDLELGHQTTNVKPSKKKDPSTSLTSKNNQSPKSQQQEPSPTKKKKKLLQPGNVMIISDKQKPKLDGKRVKLIKPVDDTTNNKWEVEVLGGDDSRGRRLTVPASKLTNV